MGKLVKKIQIASPYNIGAYESWLSDMAGRGLFLRKIGGVFCTFEKGEPSQMEYRIDISKEKISTERKSLYEESGWKYVTSVRWAHVFCAPSGTETTEIHTDAKEQGFTLAEVTKSLRVRVTIVIICTLLIFGLSYLMLFIEGTPYLNLIRSGEIWMYAFFAYPLMLFTLIKLYFEVRTLKQTLLKGRKIDHHEPWEKHKIYSILITLIALPIFVFGIMSITVMIQNAVAIMSGAARFEITQETSMPVLLLRDIEDLDDALYESELPEADESGTVNDIPSDAIIYDGSVEKISSLMALTQYEIRESARDCGRSYSRGLTSKYFKLTFAWMADGTLRDLMNYEIERYHAPAFQEMEITKMDYDGLDNVYVSNTDRYIYLFVSKDNIVVTLKYNGEKSATELLNALAGVLND